ncbi:hypothetical protein Tco_1476788 [Tanacetum coccineum]
MLVILVSKYGGTVATRKCMEVRKRHLRTAYHTLSRTEGVVGLKRWFEKMEHVFEICKCVEDDNGKTSKGTTYHQQQNQRQEAAKVYVAAPAKGRGYAGNLPCWSPEGECRTRIPVSEAIPLQNVTCLGCGKINAECYRGRHRQDRDDVQHFEDWIRENWKKRVAKAIEEYEKTRTESKNAGGSGSANNWRDCLHRNAWIKRLKSTSRISRGNQKEIYIPSKPATLHDAINMARELIEQGVQAKALRIGDSNKRK